MWKKFQGKGLESHLSECHSYGCQECTFVTKTMCSLTIHMDAEHGKTCPNCDRKFPNQVSLDKHIDSCTLVVIHTVTTMFLMNTLWWYNISSRYTIICVIIAIRLSHRKVIYWSTRDPTIFFPETIVWFVNKNFATIDELAIHMKEEHSQVCGICEETFATRSELVKPVQVDRKAILYWKLAEGRQFDTENRHEGNP